MSSKNKMSLERDSLQAMRNPKEMHDGLYHLRKMAHLRRNAWARQQNKKTGRGDREKKKKEGRGEVAAPNLLVDTALASQLLKYPCVREHLHSFWQPRGHPYRHASRGRIIADDEAYEAYLDRLVRVGRNQPFGVIGEQRIIISIRDEHGKYERAQDMPNYEKRGRLLTEDYFEELLPLGLEMKGSKFLLINTNEKPELPYETGLCERQ